MGKKFLKAFASGSVLSALAYIILGVILIWLPEISLEVIVRAAAVFVMLIGIVDIIVYICKDISNGVLNNLLSGGMILLVAGLFFLVRPQVVVGFVPTILGLAIILGGIIKLQRSIDLMRLHFEGWIFVLVLAVIDIALGIVMVINPFSAAKTLLIVIGIGLVISGITTLVTAIIVNGKTRKLMAEAAKAEEEAKALEQAANETAGEPVYAAQPQPSAAVLPQVEAAAPEEKAEEGQSKLAKMLEQKKLEREKKREQARMEKEARKLQEKAESDHNEAIRQQKEVDAIVESRLKNTDAASKDETQGYVPTYLQEEAEKTYVPETANEAAAEDAQAVPSEESSN